MAVRESRYHLDVGEVSGASFLPAWRAPVSSLCSHSYPWPWLCGLGQMSSASFDLLLCEVTSSPPPKALSQVPGQLSHLPGPRQLGGWGRRQQWAVGGGRGGGERPGHFSLMSGHNQRILFSPSHCGLGKAGRDAGTPGREGDTMVPYFSPASSVGVRGNGPSIIKYWDWKDPQWASPPLAPSLDPEFSAQALPSTFNQGSPTFTCFL